MARVCLVLLLAALAPVSGQAPSVLHVKVALSAADGSVRPIPRYALLISENPASSVPRRVVTSADGTVDVNLRPGIYTVESDQPARFESKAFEWNQTVTIAAGRNLVLELNAANAIEAAATPGEADVSALVTRLQDSVVTIWGETAHGSGFLIDAKGLIATNQRNVGSAAAAEVQLAPAVKVTARVVASSAAKNVAILWIDPAVAASVRPVRLRYAQDGPAAAGQKIFTIGSQLFQAKYVTSGTVSTVGAHAIESDLDIDRGSSGGPVFTAAGDVIGITSSDGVVAIDDARELIVEAEAKIKKMEPPKGTRLPVEPTRRLSEDALQRAVQGRTGSLNPYQMQSEDFDVSFITPVMTYGAQSQADRVNEQARKSRGKNSDAAPDVAQPLEEFTNWTDYVSEYLPVLMIRVTPKLVAGFWASVAREAIKTQGVDLGPAGKHAKAGFDRLRAFCGDAEVTPIHPFKIGHRMADGSDPANAGDAIFEGLYIFDPGALGPQCGTVKLVLFSEKAPEKGDPRVVDAKVLQQIWQDFAPYRATLR